MSLSRMASTDQNSSGQSLFMVDRDWLRQGTKPRKSWTGNVRNRSLYGLAIQVTQYDTPGTTTRRQSHAKTKRRQREKQDDATDSESQGEHESFQGRNESLMDADRHDTTPATGVNGQSIIPQNTTVSMADPADGLTSWPENPSLHPPISSGFPGLACIKGLECYLDYYLDVVGTSQHPLETRFRLQSNPIRSSWFPLAFEDDLWLKNIALYSALQHASAQNTSHPESANALMSSFLSQLNERISRSDLSDGTIASVSCLAASEHIKGNNQVAKIHASGMSEMVRLRGGLDTIERVRRSKIVRTDIIRSADTLEPPLLPRPSRESLPITSTSQGPSPHFSATVAGMTQLEMSPVLISINWTLASVCHSLEIAWKGKDTLNATSYYEHVLCLNHDLLTFSPRSAFDEALKLSLINFTQPMFRYCAFTENSCRIRAKRLRFSLEQLYLDQYDGDIILWILFTGYMNAHQTDEYEWFEARLRIACEERNLFGMSGWQELRLRLQKVLWTESIHDHLGEYFFESLRHDVRRRPPHLSNMCVTCGTNN